MTTAARHFVVTDGPVIGTEGDLWWELTRTQPHDGVVVSGWATNFDECDLPPEYVGLRNPEIAALVRPGDILLTRRDPASCGWDLQCWFFINNYTPFAGYWMHAALVVEADGQLALVESRPETGVVLIPLRDAYQFRNENIRILRVNTTDDNRHLAMDYALAQVGLPFDIRLSKRTAAQYCSELVWAAYSQGAGIDLDPDYAPFNPNLMRRHLVTGTFHLWIGTLPLLVNAVTPDDFLHSPHITVVDTAPYISTEYVERGP